MSSVLRKCSRFLGLVSICTLLAGGAWLLLPCTASDAEANTDLKLPIQSLSSKLEVGDLVFTRIPTRLFLKVADGSGGWTNHVGIVIDTSGPEPLIAESKVPRATTSPLSKFIARSDNGRVAVRRLPRPLETREREALVQATRKRLGTLYDLGFDLHSSRQFCSKFVREVLGEATGEYVGEPENLAQLLTKHPEIDQGFWKLWYLGRIPWQRETVTPVSQYESPRLETLFDGRVMGNENNKPL